MRTNFLTQGNIMWPSSQPDALFCKTESLLLNSKCHHLLSNETTVIFPFQAKPSRVKICISKFLRAEMCFSPRIMWEPCSDSTLHQANASHHGCTIISFHVTKGHRLSYASLPNISWLTCRHTNWLVDKQKSHCTSLDWQDGHTTNLQ